MATYAIGDIQGCHDSLCALVAQLRFNINKDRLWFVGDLVNRGPKSLQTLRALVAASPRSRCVLGNHDLHLLARAAGVRKQQDLDTLASVLRAPDTNDLIDWLRRQPFVHCEGGTAMVHAGVLPRWNLRRALALSEEVSARLKSRHWKDFLNEMVHGAKPHWADGVRGQKRLREALSVFTRLRYVQPDGTPDYKCKLSPDQAGANPLTRHLTPWFDFKKRRTENIRIVFGHWSDLGLIVRPNVIGLDTGCVWGRQLTAIRLEDNKIFIQPSLEGSASGTD
jgi:bis(5'-nucleosyl)-tetraphosphatase (symmetrical)